MSASQGQIADIASNDLTTNSVVGQPSTLSMSRTARVDYNRRSYDEEPPVIKDQPSFRQILPPQPTKHLSHLPTPQSPSNFSQYAPRSIHQPDSPLNARYAVPDTSPGQTSYASFRTHGSNQFVGQPPTASPMEQVEPMLPPRVHGFMTPESSPLVQRNTLPRIPELNGDPIVMTPRGSSHMHRPPAYNLQSSPLGPNGGLAPAPEITPSRSHTPTVADIHSRSTLSSPFMTRLNSVDHMLKPLGRSPVTSLPPSPATRPAHIDGLFSTPHHMSVSTPPVSPPPAGGELDRIHQARLQDQLAQVQEAETRRPDYLKRVKRSISDVDLPMEEEDRRLGLGIGITESPQKGRRLKLFQETSEESFEESLMAGGYGRYRTAEWVRQPQPLHTPHLTGSSNIVPLLEAEAAPTEQDLQKKRRLAAFRGTPNRRSGSKSRLQAVALEGRGRVLVEIPTEEEIPPQPEAIPSKKRNTNRRKKKGAPTDSEISAKEELAAVLAASRGPSVDGPNWPDTEFPWKLRTDERAQIQQLEEEEKIKWIERFLDRDTDDEDEDREGEVTVTVESGDIWNLHGDEKPDALRRGRGKWVPLKVNASERSANSRRKAFFPTDPADARAALLAKRSIRALSFRQQRRQREVERDEEGEEVLCICRGRDDGRELVQCDSCQTWYHLYCIGIKNIAQLGREEDPWFCRSCEEERESTGSDDIDMADVLASEPTFVPSDDDPHSTRHVSGPSPFFHAPGLEDSPVPSWPLPRTPTRSRNNDQADFSSGASSFTWVDSSRPGPSTPRQSAHSTRMYTTPASVGAPYGYDESPFDPTSTPSRGIKFGASFATPKSSNPWSSRAQNLFHTPSKYALRDVSHHLDRSAGALPFEHSANVDSLSPFRTISLPAYDESPIGRDRDRTERLPRHNPGRRLMEPRAFSLADSPILKGRESYNGPPAPAQRRDFLPPSMSALSM